VTTLPGRAGPRLAAAALVLGLAAAPAGAGEVSPRPAPVPVPTGPVRILVRSHPTPIVITIDGKTVAQPIHLVKLATTPPPRCRKDSSGGTRCTITY